MARLRRSACLLYQSQPVALVAKTIEGEVEKSRLSIRVDKHFHQDLGKLFLTNMSPLLIGGNFVTLYGGAGLRKPTLFLWIKPVISEVRGAYWNNSATKAPILCNLIYSQGLKRPW